MIKVGDVVLIKKLNKNAEVINILNNGIYVIGYEQLTFQVKKSEIEVINETKIVKTKPKYEERIFKTRNPFKYDVKPLEIDLHGFTLIEARKACEDIIQKAKNQKMTVVHIIHGKGTGTLRVGIQELLSSYKLKGMITSYHYADEYQGGNGKTIVYI